MTNRIINKVSNSPLIILGGFIVSLLGLLLPLCVNDIYIKWTILIFFIIYLIILTVFVIKRYYDIMVFKRNILERFEKSSKQSSKELHKFYHNLRYYIAEVNNDKNITHKNFIKIVENLCNYLEAFYRNYLGDKVCICMKMIKTETMMNSDVMSWEVLTLGRGSTCDQSRRSSDDIPVKISENTDYQLVLSESSDNKNWFASPNLQKVVEEYRSRGEEFHNSRKLFLDSYKSTIVVPIRIKTDYVSKILTSDSSHTYHVIGFLCIDSMDTYDDIEQESNFLTSLEQAKAFGDSLYSLFEDYIIKQIEQ